MIKHLAIVWVCLAGVARADDYPQWMGPLRDNVYREDGIIEAMPAGGLKVRWRAPVGGGYSGVAVAQGKVIVTDRLLKAGVPAPKDPFKRAVLAGSERVLCLDQKTGEPLWKVEYECDYTISYAAGPRCTPTVDGERVYTLGAEGHLYCINMKNGDVVWKKKLEGPVPVWGFAGHPLVDGERLIVLTSGEKGLMTAFNKMSGDVVWEALTAKDPGYCPPMIHEIAGKRQVIAWWPEGVAGLEPASGKLIWQHKYGPIRNGVSVVPPLWANETLFVSSANEGMLALKFDAPGQARELFQVARKGRESRTIHALMNEMVFHDGVIIAVSIEGELRAVDPSSGLIKWQTTQPTTGERGPKTWYTAFVTPHQPKADAAPKQFFIANEDGDFIIAKLNAKGYEEVGRMRLLEPTNEDAKRPVIWCHPAYAGRSVFWRNDKELICASLEKE